jgi:hypothetical protein
LILILGTIQVNGMAPYYKQNVYMSTMGSASIRETLLLQSPQHRRHPADNPTFQLGGFADLNLSITSSHKNSPSIYSPVDK